jgi:murein DD-endopeptidase MepM/ murein hydrolase activator NlpD
MPLAHPSPHCLRRRRRRHERRRLPLGRLALLAASAVLSARTTAGVVPAGAARPGASPSVTAPATAEPSGAAARPSARRAIPSPPARAWPSRPARQVACGVGDGARPVRRPRATAGAPSPAAVATARGRHRGRDVRPAGPAAAHGLTGGGRRADRARPGPRRVPVVSYVPPVDAPVVDPFRPPLVPWGPGNRGLEYDTAPGDLVWASGDGVVTFAGQVGGMLHVTVAHADGLRTGYSFLDDVAVTAGQAVRQGDTVGHAGTTFHFGARIGTAYVDPAALFDPGATVVELLPYEVPPGSSPEHELDLIEQAFARDRGLPHLGLGHGLDGLGGTYRWLHDRVDGLADALGDYSLPGRSLRLALDLGERLFFPGPCSHGAPPPAPAAGGHRVAVTVAGLGSTSDTAAIDGLRSGELGYHGDAVLRFSYAGGAVPDAAEVAGRFGVPTHPYASADTQGDLRGTADKLADLVEQVLAADPAATVDVYAHSQGGLVARLALGRLEARGVDLRRLGLVATLATPHAGADLATSLRLAGGQATVDRALDIGTWAAGSSIDPDAVSVAQLDEESDVIGQLELSGVPDGVRLVSIAARGDMVVASPRTEVEGATNVTVPVGGPHAHGDLVASSAATAALARALAGRPPACESVGDAVRDVVTGHAIAAVEDDAGLVASFLAP